jgi:hypothetical protein
MANSNIVTVATGQVGGRRPQEARWRGLVSPYQVARLVKVIIFLVCIVCVYSMHFKVVPLSGAPLLPNSQGPADG